MKRFLSILLLLLIIIALTSCSSKNDTLVPPKKDEVGPYELSQKEAELLQAFGLNIHNNAQVISFKTPKETKAVEVNVYVLKDGTSWETIGGTSMFANDEIHLEQLSGLFSMILRENYAIDFNLILSGGGGVAFKSEAIEDYSGHKASIKGFLPAFQEIELNKEIPVAIMVYDEGTTMRGHVPEHYYTPSVFEGMDMVQAVTLTFSDKGYD